jgi:hypothetical protein
VIFVLHYFSIVVDLNFENKVFCVDLAEEELEMKEATVICGLGLSWFETL